ncbi:hypothetical protein SISSUDRAFT_1045384 [Sistotremastrum suecicum HHB10207 ss-3]|uniref:Uncharacterized protein n=1 Tax=Sistotremastrum suecicum HHB10207 ss-3 TaxID=1314776 RepID=A0A166EF96_9AGAM|nr:hypothetical protein SISSUDRAFT_1045384 [Sistotremastrum suecicum HHB10207 ss-3]
MSHIKPTENDPNVPSHAEETANIQSEFAEKKQVTVVLKDLGAFVQLTLSGPELGSLRSNTSCYGLPLGWS